MSLSPILPLPSAPRALPDVAEEAEARAVGRIDRVGMERIELPIVLRGEDGRPMTVPAEADVFVRLLWQKKVINFCLWTTAKLNFGFWRKLPMIRV